MTEMKIADLANGTTAEMTMVMFDFRTGSLQLSVELQPTMGDVYAINP